VPQGNGLSNGGSSNRSNGGGSIRNSLDTNNGGGSIRNSLDHSIRNSLDHNPHDNNPFSHNPSLNSNSGTQPQHHHRPQQNNPAFFSDVAPVSPERNNNAHNSQSNGHNNQTNPFHPNTNPFAPTRSQEFEENENNQSNPDQDQTSGNAHLTFNPNVYKNYKVPGLSVETPVREEEDGGNQNGLQSSLNDGLHVEIGDMDINTAATQGDSSARSLGIREEGV
jgi:hypothetical protein